MSTSIKVFSAGMPPDSLWVEPIGTWTDICAGRRSADGLFVRAEDALRIFNDLKQVAGPNISTDRCGSESGTPHARVTFDTAASERAHEGNPLPCGSEYDESDFERRQRIADVKADKLRDADR